MGKDKFYAIKKGKETGIFNTWDECKMLVNGFSGAEYQGFSTLEEAQNFLGIKTKSNVIKSSKNNSNNKSKKIKSSSNKIVNPIKSEADVTVYKEYIDCNKIKNDYDIIAFVDGSYNKYKRIYGGGVVILDFNEKKYKCYTCAGYDKWDQWNIIGELEAVKLVLKIATEKYKAKNIAIYHDLVNISLWANGEWKAKNDFTIEYVKTIEKYSKEIDITFIKVKAHSNESIYNDLADETAKKAIENYIKKVNTKK